MPQKISADAGSVNNHEPAFLVLGKLRRAHGVQGEIPLEVYTHMLELLAPDSTVYIGDSHQPYTIETTRWKQELLLIKFSEINNRTIVSTLTNQLLFVKTDQMPPLSEDEYYYHNLIGLHVYEREGPLIGVLMEILQTGANDVYLVVNEQGQEFLIPAIEEVIVDIDLDQQKMLVSRLEWYGEGD